jgi:hypothetical protein
LLFLLLFVLTGVTPGGEFKFARVQAGGWADQAGFGLGSGPFGGFSYKRTSRLLPMAIGRLTAVKVEP